MNRTQYTEACPSARPLSETESRARMNGHAFPYPTDSVDEVCKRHDTPFSPVAAWRQLERMDVLWHIGITLAVIAILSVIALFASGCGTLIPSSTQTPAQQLVVLENDYNLSLAAVQVGLASGVLTKAEVAAASPYMAAVDAALTQAETDVANNTPALQADLNAANAALAKLAPLFTKAAKATKPVVSATTKAS